MSRYTGLYPNSSILVRSRLSKHYQVKQQTVVIKQSEPYYECLSNIKRNNLKK